MNSPSYVFVLYTYGDLASTKSDCAPLPNVAGRQGGTSNCWQTYSVHNTSMLAKVERDAPLSFLFLCSVVSMHFNEKKQKQKTSRVVHDPHFTISHLLVYDPCFFCLAFSFMS
jgi:hypothetical protein